MHVRPIKTGSDITDNMVLYSVFKVHYQYILYELCCYWTIWSMLKSI